MLLNLYLIHARLLMDWNHKLTMLAESMIVLRRFWSILFLSLWFEKQWILPISYRFYQWWIATFGLFMAVARLLIFRFKYSISTNWFFKLTYRWLGMWWAIFGSEWDWAAFPDLLYHFLFFLLVVFYKINFIIFTSNWLWFFRFFPAPVTPFNFPVYVSKCEKKYTDGIIL